MTNHLYIYEHNVGRAISWECGKCWSTNTDIDPEHNDEIYCMECNQEYLYKKDDID